MSANVVCMCAGSDIARGQGWLLAGAVLLWASAGCGDDAPLLEGDGGSTAVTAGDSAGSGVTPSPSGTPGEDTTGTAATTLAEDTTTAASTVGADSEQEDSGDSSSGSSSGGAPVGAVAECFDGVFVNAASGLGPDYDQFGAVPGQHCKGTDHQDIVGVQRAVFLGDSVTVGTPPWAGSQYYRSLVADALEAQFGLQFGSGFLQDEATWKGTNVFEGQAGVVHSGDFSACAAWGARTDDLTPSQIPQCFAEDDFEATTLVVMTMGGNDIANLTKTAIAGATSEELWDQVDQMLALKREAVAWLVEPGRFPNGVYVVFANVYEYTDGTGDVESCDVSGLAGFDQPVPAPDELAELVVHIQEQYMDIAVSTGTDMVFMFEGFCGHGFNADDPTAPCYRGPGNAEWFDFTCIHPNDVGHIALADMFIQTIAQ